MNNHMAQQKNLVSPEKVPNKHKGTLPSTGGKGIYVYLEVAQSCYLLQESTLLDVEKKMLNF